MTFVRIVSLAALLCGCDPRPQSSELHEKTAISPDEVQKLRDMIIGPVGSKYCTSNLAHSFAIKASPHWTIGECNHVIAVFRVPATTILGRDDQLFNIGLALDGRFEYIIARDKLSENDIKINQDKWRFDIDRYERIPGFELYLSGGSVGTRISDGWKIRHVRYWNKKNKIFCLGTSSSEITMSCLWGTPQQRYQIWFSFNDAKAVLQYVDSVAQSR